MATKTTPQQGRRTPLSLSGAVKTPVSNKGGSTTANGHQLSPTSKNQQKVDQQQQQQLINSGTNATEIKDNVPTQVTTRKQSSINMAENSGNRKREKTPNSTGNSKSQTADSKIQPPQQLNQLQTNKSDNKLKDNVAAKEVKLMKADKADKEEKNKNEKGEKNREKPNDKIDEKSQKAIDIKSAEHSPNIKSPSNEEELKIANKETPQESSAPLQEEPQKNNKGAEPPATPKKVKEDQKNAALTKTSALTSEKTEAPVCREQKETSITGTKISNNEDVLTNVNTDIVEDSPSKLHQKDNIKQAPLSPKATSTPGKRLSLKNNAISLIPEVALKSEIQLAMQSDYKIGRPRNLNQISGRPSIRPITDYTPSKFQNAQYRESYRRIDNELDNTFSSMNVTVGSEVHDNSSFSFFGRGRKRERIAPLQSVYTSPPKKPRVDFCSVVFSPITMLRNRFSKATLQSSTPVNLNAKSQVTAAKEAENDIEVQDVSGVFIQEDLSTTEETKVLNEADSLGGKFHKVGDDVTLDKEMITEKFNAVGDSNAKDDDGLEGTQKSNSFEYQHQKTYQDENADVEITETQLQHITDSPTEEDAVKNKRCVVM